MNYIREGILCRHVFCVLKSNNIESIPEKHILRRWNRNLIPADIRSRRQNFSETNQDCQRIAMDAHSAVDFCLTLLGENKEKLLEFNEKIQNIRKEIEEELPKQPSLKKKEVIEKMLGISQPESVEIKNPAGIRNKGSGTGGKRIKGKAEIAIEQSKKKQRKCAICGAIEKGHDSRTHDRFMKSKQSKNKEIPDGNTHSEDE